MKWMKKFLFTGNATRRTGNSGLIIKIYSKYDKNKWKQFHSNNNIENFHVLSHLLHFFCVFKFVFNLSPERKPVSGLVRLLGGRTCESRRRAK